MGAVQAVEGAGTESSWEFPAVVQVGDGAGATGSPERAVGLQVGG